jgi:hypothetical protein
MGPLTSRPVSEARTTTPITKTTKTTPTTTKVDQPTHSETKVNQVNTPNQVNMEPSQAKDLVVVSPKVPMDNNFKARDRDRPTTLVFQDNMVPRDSGVLHREMKVVESTLLNVVTTKDGLVKIVSPPPAFMSRT